MYEKFRTATKNEIKIANELTKNGPISEQELNYKLRKKSVKTKLAVGIMLKNCNMVNDSKK